MIRLAAGWLAVLGALSGCQSAPERIVSVYSGRFTGDSLPEDIALLKPLSFENATLLAATYGEVFAEPSSSYRWEWEAVVGTWFGDQDHQELAGHVLFRWLDFVWDDWLDTSFGFGNGLSVANDIPKLESSLHPDTGTRELLWSIAAEFEFAIPGAKSVATFVRVHHRSGVFGTFDGVDGASNVITLGLRYRW